jgi:hypothetical protein
MALPGSYLVTTKNLEEFLNALKGAKAPERVNNTFLKNLEFTSSNDRLFIGLLKMLGLADDSGTPTKRYFEFLDQSRSASVLADALREAYSDLFAVNTKAQTLSIEDLKNKFKTLTQGQYSDNVINLMAKTFKTLADLAEWNGGAPPAPQAEEKVDDESKLERNEEKTRTEAKGRDGVKQLEMRELHYNIQIVLPETRDPAVFDAIFESLRKHLT